MEKENFKKFIISLYKPVKFLTITMILSMVIAQILDLVKQYIIKGIIDLPSTENFQVTDLYHVAFILLFVIVLELIFSYISNITRHFGLWLTSCLQSSEPIEPPPPVTSTVLSLT